MKKNYLRFTITMSAVMAVILAILIVANVLLLSVYTVSVNNLFSVTEASDKTTVDTTKDDWMSLAQTIEGEGTVLLRNENNTLPLTASSDSPLKVNLLGERAYNPVYGGTGSGGGDSSSAVTLPDALNQNGFEVNPAIEESGIHSGIKYNDGHGIGMGTAELEMNEAPLSVYTGDISFDSLKEYSDIAIVVFGRAGGEGSDLTAYEKTEDRHYLELSSTEEALLEKARETFGTVIVLYNGANALEMGFLETYGIDAALWIGDPGVNGFPAVAQILNGTINPSGRLVDTFAYDATSAPSYQNFGEQVFSNSPAISETTYLGEQVNYVHYVDYVEGIYVGYKWYETADAEGFFDGESNEYGTGYDAVVQYPFGYGLSYTTFKQEIVGGTEHGSLISPTGTITLQVKVTNTGNATGKEVVQAYVTAPYTDYDKTNGVEKAEVSLVAYAKTQELKPGESETVELTVDVEALASYDETCSNSDGTTGSYMLDAGTYTISVRNNAHSAIESIDLTLSDQYFFSGDNKRSNDEVAASNQLQDSKRGVYLSRKDGFANYEEAMSSVTDVASDAILEELNKEGTYDSSYDEAITTTYTAGTDYRTGEYKASSGDLTLADMAGVDYDDERWDQLLSQMSLSEMASLVGTGGWSTVEITSIGKKATIDVDGPSGISSMFDTSKKGVQYPCTAVLAASWNTSLARTYGEYIADEAHDGGVSGWYAPGMNIHRSPFSGRNFEYYSEDSLISGVVAANTVAGTRSNGLYAYIKHFALNDQETCRDARITTWSNEQATREIYLKPFEMAVKDGGAVAVMTSMNYVGATWAGNKPALLINILRSEWGFQGFTVTDACTGAYMDSLGGANTGVRSGQDLWLAMGVVSVNTDTDADIYYVMRSAKNILYAQANSTLISTRILPWKTALYVLDGLLVVGFVVCGVFLTRNVIAWKKNKKGSQTA